MIAFFVLGIPFEGGIRALCWKVCYPVCVLFTYFFMDNSSRFSVIIDTLTLLHLCLPGHYCSTAVQVQKTGRTEREKRDLFVCMIF